MYYYLHTLTYINIFNAGSQLEFSVVSRKRTRTAKTAVLTTAGVQVPEYVFEEITLIYLDLDLAKRQFF